MENEDPFIDERDQEDIMNTFQDEFMPLRFKQLFSSILAEFKTVNPNMMLTEEEL